jgi:hypothetical protein
VNIKEREVLAVMIKPICKILAESYAEAILLRCTVMHDLAVYNGAEPEDLGDVIAKALETAQPITAKWLDEIGMVKRAQKISEGDYT